MDLSATDIATRSTNTPSKLWTNLRKLNISYTSTDTWIKEKGEEGSGICGRNYIVNEKTPVAIIPIDFDDDVEDMEVVYTFNGAIHSDSGDDWPYQERVL